MAKYTAEEIEASRACFMDSLEVAKLLDSIDRLTTGEVADLLSRGIRKDVDLEGDAAKMFNWLFHYYSSSDLTVALRVVFPGYEELTGALAELLLLEDEDEDVLQFGLDLFLDESSYLCDDPRRLASVLRSVKPVEKTLQKVFLWGDKSESNRATLIAALAFNLSVSTPQPH